MGMSIDPKAAYEEVEAMLLSLDAREITKLCLDAGKAADTALGAAPRIEPFRERISALSETDVSDLDLLPRLAGAVLWIQTRIAKESRSAVRELAEASFAHRSKLVVAAPPLVQAGLMDSEQIERVGRSRGYRKVAADLLVLASAYESAWPQVEGKTTVTRQDVLQAAALHDRLVSALVTNEDSEAPDSKQMRARALSLLHGSYRRLRKALCYLCESESQVRQIMPSLRFGPRKQKPAGPKPASSEAASSAELPAPKAAGTTGPPAPEIVHGAAIPTPASPRAEATAEEPAPRPAERGHGPVASPARAPVPSNGATDPPSVVPG